MTKYLIVIAAYNDWRQEFYETYTRPHNKKYAYKNNFEYIELSRNEIQNGFRNVPTWNKFSSVLDLINKGFIKNGSIITHIDADMCIKDHSVSLQSNKSFSYAIDSCNTHCMGMYSIFLNDWSYQLLQNILSENRYQKLKDKITIDSMNEQSSFWNIFREQASWYSLAGIQRHSWIPFICMSHWGWHSNADEDTLYSLDELYKNVEILPSCWNVTHLPEEDGNDQFFMIPVKNEHVVIRHFAGGRSWRKEYFIN